jgi:GTP-binding protein
VDLDGERRFVVADLPGLIAGAHQGKGLGLEFLRHIERTRALAFLVEVVAEDPRAELAMVERELGEYSRALLEKPRVVVLTKADLLSPERREQGSGPLGLPEAHLVSAQSGLGMEALLESLWQMVAPSAEVEGKSP